MWYILKQSLSAQSPGSPGIQVVFISFPPFVFLPLALHTLHIFSLDLESIHPSEISLLPGQWFHLVSLAMLSIPGVLLSSFGR